MSLEEGVPIKCVYGYIEEVLTPSEDQEDEFYIVRVSRENTLGPVETYYPIIPMEQTIEELASLYGPPSGLIGRRVRIDYTGRDFTSGVARVVANPIPGRGRQHTETQTRGFRYASPGGGGTMGGMG